LALVILEIGSPFLPRPGWNAIFPFNGFHYHPQLFCCKGVSQTAPPQPWAGFKLWSSWSQPPKQLGLQTWATMMTYPNNFLFFISSISGYLEHSFHSKFKLAFSYYLIQFHFKLSFYHLNTFFFWHSVCCLVSLSFVTS
jgi:hypothetical protein